MSNTTATASPAPDDEPQKINSASAGSSHSVTFDQFGKFFTSPIVNGPGSGILSYSDKSKVTSGVNLGLPPGVTMEPLPHIISAKDAHLMDVRNVAKRLNDTELQGGSMEWGEFEGELVRINKLTGRTTFWPDGAEVGKTVVEKAVAGLTTEDAETLYWLRDVIWQRISTAKFWLWAVIVILVLRGLIK